MESKILTSVKINNVPLAFWEEFKNDAERNFANNYIMKIMIDHYRRVQGDERIDAIIARIEEIETVLMTVIPQPMQEEIKEEKKRKVPTFGERKNE